MFEMWSNFDKVEWHIVSITYSDDDNKTNINYKYTERFTESVYGVTEIFMKKQCNLVYTPILSSFHLIFNDIYSKNKLKSKNKKSFIGLW